MRIYLIALLAAALCVPVHADEAGPDPEQWYREAYGPLWADKPAEQVSEILRFYADTVETHEIDGEISHVNKVDWLGTPMAQWSADGWLSSTLMELKVDRINPSTTSFKASWRDHYKSAEDETSCGWYLADLQEGRWTFTAYADIDCAAHGF